MAGGADFSITTKPKDGLIVMGTLIIRKEKQNGQILLHSDLAENHLTIAEMLGDQAGDKRFEGLAGFGKDEGLRVIVPVEFEAGGQSRNPDLSDRSIGSENKFGGRFFKADVEHSILFFHFKVGIGLGEDESFFQGFQSAVRVAPKADLVKHGASVPILAPHRMPVE